MKFYFYYLTYIKWDYSKTLYLVTRVCYAFFIFGTLCVLRQGLALCLVKCMDRTREQRIIALIMMEDKLLSLYCAI